MSCLDFSDPEAVAQWLHALSVAWMDADAVSTDMLRRPRDRELGPVLHAEKYHEARAKILEQQAKQRQRQRERARSLGSGGGGSEGPEEEAKRARGARLDPEVRRGSERVMEISTGAPWPSELAGIPA